MVMDKPFGKFINLIYIEGYFEKGYVDGLYFEPKPLFVLNLLTGSVAKPDRIRFSKQAINGYIGGDQFDSVVEALNDAEYNKELLANHIEGLYETKHKDTKTYRDRYNGKSYKEALHEKVKVEFSDVTFDNMSNILAERFHDILGMDKDQEHVNIKSKDKTDPAQVTYSYTISESEKKEVKNICSLIDESIKKLHKIGVAINGIRSTIHNYDNESKWRLSLWKCLREQMELYNSEYDNCSQYCSALANLLKTKVRIKACIKALHDIANDIVDNKYIASQKDYSLEEFNTMMKMFQDNHKLLLGCIDEL
jgi:hypothetical protein